MDANETNKYVVFKLDNEEYGIDILRVKEIKEMMRITRIPKTPDYVRGVINLRGEVIPVVDLKKKFNLQQTGETESSRIIIITVDEITIGLITDTSSEVLEIEGESIEEPPATISNIDHAYIKGIGKVNERLIILLDVSKIINITA